MLRIYVPGGITSSLFAVLLPGFLHAKHHIFAAPHEPHAEEPETVRAARAARLQTLREFGVEFLAKEESLQKTFDAVLWLASDHVEADLRLLAAFAQKCPTLAISSGALMDFYLGTQTEAQLNKYQRSKLDLSRLGIRTLIPGFYVADLPSPDWASRGLHGETTLKLFAQNVDSALAWNKAYSVTPLSIMVRVINEWLDHPETFPPNEPIIVCSDRQYRRWELRNMGLGGDSAEIAQEPPLPELLYAKFPHATNANCDNIIVTDDIVKAACQVAAQIIQNGGQVK